MLSLEQRFVKRSFDLIFSALGLLFTFWIIIICWFVIYVHDFNNGFFFQERVGRYGRKFKIVKLRTMKFDPFSSQNVTTSRDTRITKFGSFLRRFKIDELPQLYNVVCGDMSLVGPRPDVTGFADALIGEEKIILTVRPGITGPASLTFRDEETLLAVQQDPVKYNREVIWPQKVQINYMYVKNWSLRTDLLYIFRTLIWRW